MRKKIVIIFGVFDIFHEGHKNFIKQARERGDYLIAVIARDKTVLEIKDKFPRNNEKIRLKILRNSGLVDKVVIGSLKDKYAAIKKYNPSVICLGYDQTNFIDGLLKKIQNPQLKIIRLKPYKPDIYKSSLLK